MKRPGTPPSLLFRLVVPACAVFILTILGMIASVFGNPEAPVAKWIDRNVGTILTVEFFTIISLSVLAMFVDRVRTLQSACPTPSSSEDSLQNGPEHSQSNSTAEPHSTDTNDLP